MSTFDALQKKYEDFAVPTFKITANGSEFARTDFNIYNVSVDLSVGETCGACRFSVGNIYERGARKITPAALEKLKPGTELCISLGYGSKYTQVFAGYIDELNLHFDEEGLYLVVYSLDARNLMRENTRRFIYKDKKMADIINSTLDDYSKLIKSRSVNVVALEQETSIAQDGDDLSFVVEAAENRSLLVYMENDKFVMDKASDTICLELEWEEFEMEFGMKYLDTKIHCVGCDSTNTERFAAEKPAKQKADQAGLITTNRHIILGSYLSGDSVTKIAEAMAESAVSEALYGRITLPHGVPEVLLGQKVKITKFPLSPSKTGDTFTIVGIGHKINDENGFETALEISG